MKAPRYMSIEQVKSNPPGYIVKIERWGWPIIIAKCVKERVSAKWYMWPVVWVYFYPKICVRVMRGVI